MAGSSLKKAHLLFTLLSVKLVIQNHFCGVGIGSS